MVPSGGEVMYVPSRGREKKRGCRERGVDVDEEEKEKREDDVSMRKVQCRVQSSKAGGKERLIHD